MSSQRLLREVRVGSNPAIPCSNRPKNEATERAYPHARGVDRRHNTRPSTAPRNDWQLVMVQESGTYPRGTLPHYEPPVARLAQSQKGGTSVMGS